MPNVTSYQVTGDWRHIIDDGMVDVDALPDEALPTGHVIFTPLSPKVAVAGAPAVAHTLGEVKALIAGGALTDLQGREGIWMAGKIGDQPVRWRAVTHLFYKGQKIAYPVLEFDLVDDAVLTGLIQNSEPGQPPIIVDPRIEALVREAQAALNETRMMLAEATEFHEDVERWYGEIMPAAAQVATDRQIAHDASALAVLAAANAGRIMGTGSPEGSRDAPIGTIFVDTANGELWHKTTAEGSTSGWKRVGTGAAEAKSWRQQQITNDPLLDNMKGVEFEGMWGMSSAYAAENGMPTVVAYVIEIIQSGSITYNRAIAMLNPTVTYERRHYNGTWTPWVKPTDGLTFWNRGSLASNATPTDVDNLPDGQYYIPTTARSQSAGMPEGGLGILTCLIPTSAYKRQYWTTEPTNGEPSRWRRTFNSGSWNAWTKLAGADTSALEARVGTAETKITNLEGVVNGGGGGGLSREESMWALEREGRIADMRRRRGHVTVPPGVGLVALTFDHHTTKFRDNLWPLLSARNLPATLALNSARHLDGRTMTDALTTDNATNAQIKSWINTGRLEIANHSKTHDGTTGYAGVFDEIVNGQAELEAALGVPVDHWIQPGYPTGDPDYDGFGRGYSTKVYWNTTAGRLIMKGHPGITGMISHPTDVLPIDGHIPIGTRRQGYDSRTGWEAAKAQIQLAADTGGRCINFCHPSSIYANDSSNQTFTKLFEFEEMLDLIVSLQNQGKIRAVLLSDWMIAQRSQA